MQQAQKQQLPASLQKIVGAFQIVPDPMARYKQLLFYAAKLPKMAAEDHVPENKVEGCVSQVGARLAHSLCDGDLEAAWGFQAP
jgi:sulfur transfer protein SufE